jgi:hypothetical protein
MWIGRRGSVEWPLKSTDFTPSDFSVWGIKSAIKYSVLLKLADVLQIAKEPSRFKYNSLSVDKKLCVVIC